MDSIKKLMKENGVIIKIVVAIVLFVLAGFTPLIDVAGKETINGFKVLFEGTGMGFSRFVCFFVICAPVVTCLFTIFKSIEDRLTLFGFAVCFAAIVVFWLVLPGMGMISLAAGGIFYLLISLVILILNIIEVRGDSAEDKKKKSGLV